jgi:hypothetical protein
VRLALQFTDWRGLFTMLLAALIAGSALLIWLFGAAQRAPPACAPPMHGLDARASTARPRFARRSRWC